MLTNAVHGTRILLPPTLGEIVMCTLPSDPNEAAHRLALLINKHFKADTDATAVERVIRDHWSSFVGLAHAAHDEIKRDRRRYQGSSNFFGG